MKRAVFIVMAALLVLLAYPSTYSLAKESDLSSGPSIVSPKSADGGVALSGSGGGDGGDADDLSGVRHRTRTEDVDELINTSSAASFRTFLQVWWSFMVMAR